MIVLITVTLVIIVPVHTNLPLSLTLSLSSPLASSCTRIYLAPTGALLGFSRMVADVSHAKWYWSFRTRASGHAVVTFPRILTAAGGPKFSPA